jgi:hypothetical protein
MAPQQLSVSCADNPITRGDTITCTAAAGGEALQVTGWQFVTLDSSQTITRSIDTTASTWRGPLVTSGYVVVGGTIGGQPVSASTQVTANPRDWSSKTRPLNISQIFVGDPLYSLPQRPDTVSDFGLSLHRTVVRSGIAVSVGSGPNQGLIYYTDIPFDFYTSIQINTAALADGSDFQQIQESTQRTIRGVTYCGRDKVPAMVSLVEAHEGTNGETNSHAGIFHDQATRVAREQYEGLVIGSTMTQDSLNFIRDSVVLRIASDSSRALDSDPTRNPATDGSIGCRFHFEYATLGGF